MIVNRKVRPHCNVCNVLRRSYGAADSIGVYETRNTGQNLRMFTFTGSKYLVAYLEHFSH